MGEKLNDDPAYIHQIAKKYIDGLNEARAELTAFERVQKLLPELTAEQRGWLREALSRARASTSPSHGGPPTNVAEVSP
jgi:hypothetical protein